MRSGHPKRREEGWTAVWAPWGSPHAITGTATLDARFHGQWYQLEAGFHYNWHRHYDPTLGRYTQPDPLGFVDGPSRYAYAGSNPVSSAVPLGLMRYDPGASANHMLPDSMKPEKSDGCGSTSPPSAPPPAPTIVPIGSSSCDGPLSGLQIPGLACGPEFGGGFGGAGGFGGGKQLPMSDQQLGRKFGEHMDASREGYRNYQEYRDLANRIYNDPNAMWTSHPWDAPLYRGEVHIIDKQGNLLRLDVDGNFRSLYPTR